VWDSGRGPDTPGVWAQWPAQSPRRTLLRYTFVASLHLLSARALLHTPSRQCHSPSQREERLLHPLVRLRTRLEESEAELVRKFPTLFDSDSALLVPVAFVSNEDFVDARGSVLLDVGVPSADVWSERGAGCGRTAKERADPSPRSDESCGVEVMQGVESNTIIPQLRAG